MDELTTLLQRSPVKQRLAARSHMEESSRVAVSHITTAGGAPSDSRLHSRTHDTERELPGAHLSASRPPTYELGYRAAGRRMLETFAPKASTHVATRSSEAKPQRHGSLGRALSRSETMSAAHAPQAATRESRAGVERIGSSSSLPVLPKIARISGVSGAVDYTVFPRSPSSVSLASSPGKGPDADRRRLVRTPQPRGPQAVIGAPAAGAAMHVVRANASSNSRSELAVMFGESIRAGYMETLSPEDFTGMRDVGSSSERQSADGNPVGDTAADAQQVWQNVTATTIPGGLETHHSDAERRQGSPPTRTPQLAGTQWQRRASSPGPQLGRAKSGANATRVSSSPSQRYSSARVQRTDISPPPGHARIRRSSSAPHSGSAAPQRPRVAEVGVQTDALPIGRSAENSSPPSSSHSARSEALPFALFSPSSRTPAARLEEQRAPSPPPPPMVRGPSFEELIQSLSDNPSAGGLSTIVQTAGTSGGGESATLPGQPGSLRAAIAQHSLVTLLDTAKAELSALRQENQALQDQVSWRNGMIDYIKRVYHRDVFLIREHLYRLSEKLASLERRAASRAGNRATARGGGQLGMTGGSSGGQTVRRRSFMRSSSIGSTTGPEPSMTRRNSGASLHASDTEEAAAHEAGHEEADTCDIPTARTQGMAMQTALGRVMNLNNRTPASVLRIRSEPGMSTLHPAVLPTEEEAGSMWAPADFSMSIESSANLRELMQLFGLHTVVTALDKHELDRLKKIEIEHKQLQGKYESLARSSQALVERHAMLSDSATALAARMDDLEDGRRRAMAEREQLQRRIAEAAQWRTLATANIDMLKRRLKETQAEIAALQYKSANRGRRGSDVPPSDSPTNDGASSVASGASPAHDGVRRVSLRISAPDRPEASPEGSPPSLMSPLRRSSVASQASSSGGVRRPSLGAPTPSAASRPARTSLGSEQTAGTTAGRRSSLGAGGALPALLRAATTMTRAAGRRQSREMADAALSEQSTALLTAGTVPSSSPDAAAGLPAGGGQATPGFLTPRAVHRRRSRASVPDRAAAAAADSGAPAVAAEKSFVFDGPETARRPVSEGAAARPSAGQ